MSTTFKWDGDPTDVVRALQQMITKQKEQIAGIKEQVKETNKVDREQQKMAKSAKKIYESTRTPQEQYKQGLKEIRKLHQAGHVDLDTMRRREVQLGDAQKRRLSTSRQVNGPNALSMVKGMIGGYLGLSQVTQQWGAALNHARGEQDAALSTMERMIDIRRKFSSVSGTEEEAEAMDVKTSEMAVKHGVERDTVGDMMFAAKSDDTGQYTEKTIDRLLQFADSLAPDVANTIAEKIPKLFQGEASVDALQAVNMVFESAKSSVLTPEEIGRQMPTAAEGGAMAGASPEETAAVLARLGGQFATGSNAATRMRAFGTKVSTDKDLAGGGFVETVRKLEQGTEEERKAFLGSSQELIVAYDKIKGILPEIDADIANIKRQREVAGTAGSSLSQAPTTDRQRAMRDTLRTRIAEEVAQENVLGEGKAGVEQILNTARTKNLESGGGFAERAGITAGGNPMGLIGEGEAVAGAGMGGTAGRIIDKMIENPLKAIGPMQFVTIAQELSAGIGELMSPTPEPSSPGRRQNRPGEAAPGVPIPRPAVQPRREAPAPEAPSPQLDVSRTNTILEEMNAKMGGGAVNQYAE